MSFLLSGPVLFIDDDDLDVLVLEYSDRVRRDPALRPTLERLIGNRWAHAESAIASFFRATLFCDSRPPVDANWLARAVRLLSVEEVDRLTDILLECSLTSLPLHSAATVTEVAEEFGRVLKSIIILQGVEQQRQLLSAYSGLASGALFASL